MTGTASALTVVQITTSHSGSPFGSLLEARNWPWCYVAWQEYNAWDLNRDNSFTPSSPPPYLSDSNRTDRGVVIYNALQKNNSP